MMMLLLLALLLLLVTFADAFTRRSMLQRGISSSTRHYGEVLVTNGDNGKTTKIASGSPLSLACTRVEQRLSFQCKQGTCRSCEVKLDGKVVLSCQTKVPDKKAIKVSKAK